MATILKNLLTSHGAFPSLLTLEHITLISGMSELEKYIKRGRILAQKLNIIIQITPALTSEHIRDRHPEWFANYYPDPTSHEFVNEAVQPFFRDAHEIQLINNERIYSLISLLIKLRKMINRSRTKRFGTAIPAIYINLGRVLLNDLGVNVFVEQYKLLPDAGDKIRAIITEYSLWTGVSNDVFLQCYFDIILDVESLRHLATWFLP
ncbi:hypothetical protein [Martelella alba]|uniref:Uncharacterized protein n=1 Tax=Martelella alba TaxID=2590451 RepID=A0ABY2SKR2_9HYPH|nr:hypothetical protein [Martelella alba]TKI06164.1 hypothetical protein FCN80_11670 [Martelella alba]